MEKSLDFDLGFDIKNMKSLAEGCVKKYKTFNGLHFNGELILSRTDFIVSLFKNIFL